jgi:hypothetical protein
MGEAFFLAMPLFVAVPVDDVGVAGFVVTGLTIVVGRTTTVLRWESAFARPKCGDLLDFLFGQLFPDDLTGFFWLKLGPDSSNLVKPLMVILNGLQVAGHFHPLIEGVFFSLQDLVTEAILKSSEEKLVLDKLEGIRDAFGFGLSHGGSNSSENSHGGWLIVGEAFVGRLDPVGVVVDGLLGFLI